MEHERAGRIEQGLLITLAGLSALSALLVIEQAMSLEPLRLPGILIDRMSAIIGLLVAVVGAVVFRFSLRALDGEPGQRQFLHWLFSTVVVAFLLIHASNLLLLAAAWAWTSLGLHKLLTFYQDRPEAQRPARKKFLISRLGDLALLAAIALIGVQWGTLDLHEFLGRATAPTPWPGAPIAVALLIVAAALTKSAQFPFHTWLPETMEAPTPVSALMHAGVINAGGVLILHFAPLIASAPEALFLLALVGTITATLGTITMWAQTDIKRTLAWSTVSQMGFMMVQCGLAAFPAAALHIVGHGCYKAWSFLRSGGIPAPAPLRAAPPAQALAQSLVGALLAAPAIALAAWVTGFDPLHSPGELALSAILALSIGQLWGALQRSGAWAGRARHLAGLLTIGGAALLALGLYQGAAQFLAPSLGPIPVPASPLAWAAAALPVVALSGLVILHALLPALGGSAPGRALYIHAANGFYLGIYANRIVDQIWRGAPARAGGKRPA